MNELTLNELVAKIKAKMDLYWFIETIEVDFDTLIDALHEAGVIEENYQVLLEETEDYETDD